MLHFDLTHFIITFGLLGIALIVFAESGLLIGFFLPGDTLLFTAGILAAQGYFNIHILVAVLFVAAILGDNVGYTFGKRVGPRLFKRKDSILFHEEHVIRAEKFYNKHGGKTVILARFIPIVRTFAPVVAGVGKMERRKFFIYNLVGAALWTASMSYIGFYLGSKIPNIDHYVLPIIGIAVVVSLASSLGEIFRHKKSRDQFKELCRQYYRRFIGRIIRGKKV